MAKKILLISGFLLLFSPPAALAGKLTCSDHAFQVRLTPDDQTTYEVIGTFCARGQVAGKTLQLLLPGATYSRTYWDFPFQPDHYSYVRAATGRGYATLNIDRIGIGASAHPSGFAVTVPANVHVVHQIILALRAGLVADHPFEKIIAVGHSLGSLIAVNLAADYPGDVDGLILSGYLHNLNPDFLATAFDYYYPAYFDPRFFGQFPDYDYLTTIPETRRTIFYNEAAANPRVIALDESTKETVTMGEFQSLLFYDDPASLRIEVPVMMLLGEYDNIVCGGVVDCGELDSVRDLEEQFFSPEACLEISVIGDAGHSLNLQNNAHKSYSRMLHWADRLVGVRPGPARESCPE